MIVEFIDDNRDDLGVEPICRVLPSVYYAAKTRPASARSQRDVFMTTALVAPWHDNDRVYGARKLWRPPAAPATTSAATRSPG